MRIRHRGNEPRISPDAYVAPGAVVSGDVTIGSGSRVLYGAVLTSEGGPVSVGAECVVMENAVLRGVPGNALAVGDHVLVGPHAHLSGCVVEDGAFLATGCAVFNGARVGAGAEIRIHGVLHVNSRLPDGVTIPIGWVGVGDPAEILPAERHDDIWNIQRTLDFPGTVFGAPRSKDRGERTRRYARGLGRHLDDLLLESGER